MRVPVLPLLIFFAAASACESDDTNGLGDGGIPTDQGLPPDDAGVTDAEAKDASSPDQGPTDLGAPDLGFRPGCETARFRPAPADPTLTGPWTVGVRTATVAGLRTEIWYPAAPGTEAGAPAVRYDLRRALPDSEQSKIADADTPFLDCDCYRDLPLDPEWGPYPVIVFVHGTAGVRYQSLPQMTHWASRGFVVVSADFPGLYLKDLLITTCGQGLPMQDNVGNLTRLLAALRAPSEGLAFLAGRIDGRLGLSGHSAGGNAISGFGDQAQVMAPLASRGVADGQALESVLIMGGTSDRVVAASVQREGYRGAPSPKRLVLLENAGHLAFSVFCDLRNPAGENIVEAARARGVCGLALAGALFDCNDSYLADPEAWTVINHATTAAFEETLQCREAASRELSDTASRFPNRVGSFEEDL
ncbi:MAG: hypothetical protein AAFZ18_05300 [Myxococcota bacterium]